MLLEHTKAPDFSLPDQDNQIHSLKDFLGKWVLLYFYPQDNTAGCTAEACTIRDNYSELEKKLIVLGVSSDSVDSHKKFAQTYHLLFLLLSDSQKKVIEMYQATNGLFTKRISYLISPSGEIIKAYPHVTPDNHAVEILQDISVLQAR